MSKVDRCWGRTIYVMCEMKLYMTDTWCWHRVPYTLDICSITRQGISTVSSSIERIPLQTCIEYLLMCRYRTTTLPIPATFRLFVSEFNYTGHVASFDCTQLTTYINSWDTSCDLRGFGVRYAGSPAKSPAWEANSPSGYGGSSR